MKSALRCRRKEDLDVYKRQQVICRKENEIWIGSAQGLFRYNMDTELMKHYMYDPNDNNSLSQMCIRDRHKGYPFYTIGQRRGLGIDLNRAVFVKEIIPAENKVIPVSYTHLDVYKRQLLYYAAISFPFYG